MKDQKFDNQERRRYYGLRIGDTVELLFTHKKEVTLAEVVEYGFMDNNRVWVKLEDGTTTDWVAEWCK